MRDGGILPNLDTEILHVALCNWCCASIRLAGLSFPLWYKVLFSIEL